MQQFGANHDRTLTDDDLSKIAAALADDETEKYQAPSDLTDEETARLADALAEITHEITERFGYFEEPLTRDRFLAQWDEDITRLRSEAEEGEQINRFMVQEAWLEVGNVCSFIFMMLVTNREGAIEAIKFTRPDIDVDSDYLTESLNAVSDKLAEASALADQISESRGEPGL